MHMIEFIAFAILTMLFLGAITAFTKKDDD